MSADELSPGRECAPHPLSSADADPVSPINAVVRAAFARSSTSLYSLNRPRRLRAHQGARPAFVLRADNAVSGHSNGADAIRPCGISDPPVFSREAPVPDLSPHRPRQDAEAERPLVAGGRAAEGSSSPPSPYSCAVGGSRKPDRKANASSKSGPRRVNVLSCVGPRWWSIKAAASVSCWTKTAERSEVRRLISRAGYRAASGLR
jgi:hypothetical protein